MVAQEGEQVAGRVVEGAGVVGRPDGGDEGLHEQLAEVVAEAVVVEELPQRPQVACSAADEPSVAASRARAARWKRGMPTSIRQNDGLTALRQVGKTPPAPSAPAHSRPRRSSRIDIDISDSRVVTPSSANMASRCG